jgi:hypothetical protein
MALRPTGRAALAALCLLIAAGVWLVARGSVAGGPAPAEALRPGAAPGPAPTPATGASAALPGAAAPARADAREPAVPGEAAIAERPSLPVPADALWLEGQVLLPEGTPADERLRVSGRGAPFRGLPGAPAEHVVAAGPDGRFRLAVARDTQLATLTLEGRWLRLPTPVVVEVDPSEELRVLLAPELCGQARLRLRGAPEALAGHELRCAGARGTTGASGEVLLMPLPPGTHPLLLDGVAVGDVTVRAGRRAEVVHHLAPRSGAGTGEGRD